VSRSKTETYDKNVCKPSRPEKRGEDRLGKHCRRGGFIKKRLGVRRSAAAAGTSGERRGKKESARENKTTAIRNVWESRRSGEKLGVERKVEGAVGPNPWGGKISLLKEGGCPREKDLYQKKR